VIFTSNTADFDQATVPSTMTRVHAVTPDDFFEQLIDEGLGNDIRATIECQPNSGGLFGHPTRSSTASNSQWASAQLTLVDARSSAS
jgi:hypothetical protein